jgi:hypothetical protein
MTVALEELGAALDRAALHYSNIDPEYRRRERAV